MGGIRSGRMACKRHIFDEKITRKPPEIHGKIQSLFQKTIVNLTKL
jgi:hypothetical protein